MLSFKTQQNFMPITVSGNTLDSKFTNINLISGDVSNSTDLSGNSTFSVSTVYKTSMYTVKLEIFEGFNFCCLCGSVSKHKNYTLDSLSPSIVISR